MSKHHFFYILSYNWDLVDPTGNELINSKIFSCVHSMLMANSEKDRSLSEHVYSERTRRANDRSRSAPVYTKRTFRASIRSLHVAITPERKYSLGFSVYIDRANEDSFARQRSLAQCKRGLR